MGGSSLALPANLEASQLLLSPAENCTNLGVFFIPIVCRFGVLL